MPQIVTAARSGACGLMILTLAACVTSQSHNAPATGSRADLVAGSLDSSVQLFTDRMGGAHRAGSGVVLTAEADGTSLILTAAHLVEPPTDQIVEVVSPRTGQRVGARILASDPDADIAVVEASGLPVTPVRLKPEARLGEDVWVMSFPWGRRGTLVNGVVSQIAGNGPVVETEGSVALIDAVVGYGTSGGGVFDDGTGGLIGIVRGYRTARLSLSGDEAQTLDLPIAGETTVISTGEIVCFLQAEGLAARMPASTRRSAGACTEG